MHRIFLSLLAIMFPTALGFGQSLAPEDLARRTMERRAVEAFLWGLPAVNTDLMRQEMLTKTPGKIDEVIYWGHPMEWHNQTLTPNPDALYFMTFFDLRNGPIVLDLPAGDAGGSFNGNIVTMWQMPLEDAGLLGADKGAGGKYVILPPGYKEKIPNGYIPLQSDTLGGYALVRSNIASHSDADVAKSIAYGKKMKVYPLAQAADPPPTVFTDVKDFYFDSTIRYDASYFQNLNRIVQEEPWLERDRLMINSLKSLGIEKGKPFNPDAQTTKLLDAGAKEAGAILEGMYDDGWGIFFEGTQWRPAAAAEAVKMQASGYGDPNAYPSDLRAMTYSYGYVGIKRLGAGQFYLLNIRDKGGHSYDGSKTYKLTVPPNAPVDQYWSVTAYDRQTHALIKNMPRASRSSQIADMQKNADGSLDIYFGPKAPVGKDNNWVPTDPARKFEVMFRVYAPRKEFFDKVWVLPDLEQVAAQ